MKQKKINLEISWEHCGCCRAVLECRGMGEMGTVAAGDLVAEFAVLHWELREPGSGTGEMLW